MNEWKKPRTIFALMFYFLYCCLVSLGLDVPDTLNGIINLLMGFWFGTNVTKNKEVKGE